MLQATNDDSDETPYDKTDVVVAHSAPTVTATRRLPLTPRGELQARLLSEVQVLDAVVPPKRTTGL
jgi:hypothetical protein